MLEMFEGRTEEREGLIHLHRKHVLPVSLPKAFNITSVPASVPKNTSNIIQKLPQRSIQGTTTKTLRCKSQVWI